MKNIFILLVATISITSCAVSYKKATYTQLGEDVFSVRFDGNGYNTAGESNDFCLLKCADLAQSKGYKYFVVLENKEDSKVDIASSMVFHLPSNHASIKLYRVKPNISNVVYESSFVYNSIRSKYKLK